MLLYLVFSSYQHDSQVNRHHSLKEEGLEVVCGVTNDIEKDGGEEDGQEVSEEPSAKGDFHDDGLLVTIELLRKHLGISYKVLGELSGPKVAVAVTHYSNEAVHVHSDGKCHPAFLCVKWKPIHFIIADPFCLINTAHFQGIFQPRKDIGVVHFTNCVLGKVALSIDRDG